MDSVSLRVKAYANLVVSLFEFVDEFLISLNSLTIQTRTVAQYLNVLCCCLL